MAKYDGLIIPRSYNDYINKSSPIDVSQALQLSGVMDNAPTAQSTKPAKSGGIFAANAVIMASNKTLSGVAISAGSVVRVLFTAALTGSDSTTGLTLTYNGNAYAVKVGKNGALANFLANNIDGSYIYCQAYTTLDLMFDGSQFIIMGNPVVISSADYTIYTDGSLVYKDSAFKRLSLTPNIFAGGSVNYNKSGNYVNLFFNRLVTNNQIAEGGYVTVGTLPEGYRPSADLGTAGIICGTSSGNRQKYSVTISKSGEIFLFNDYGNLANTLFYGMGMITFPIDF